MEKANLELITECSDGTQILKGAGHKSPGDFKIYVEFPVSPWPLTYEVIGVLLNFAAKLEDINYPSPYRGRKMLAEYVAECIEGAMPKDIAKKYGIKIKEVAYARI
jgi:hypothetical protein